MDTENRSTLQKLFHEAVARRDAIEAEVKPLRDRRAALQEQIRPQEEEILKLTDEIRGMEHPRLIEAMNEAAQLARALKPNPDHPVARTGLPPPKDEPEVAAKRGPR